MMRKYPVRFGGGSGEKGEQSNLARGLPYTPSRTCTPRWAPRVPQRRRNPCRNTTAAEEFAPPQRPDHHQHPGMDTRR
jgi:hypothetical protein